jgi:hypothetical protein
MPAPADTAERSDGGKVEGRRTQKEGRSPALERVTVNLTPRSAQALELATQLTGDSKTDAINRAVQVYAFLERAIAEGGSIRVQESAESEPELLKIF